MALRVHRPEACAAALRANAALAQLNQSLTEPYGHGIALHWGKAQYGNIGAERRLVRPERLK